MKTPDEWMREFDARIADAQRKAAVVREGLATAHGTATSKDGVVTVTVAPNGALTELKLTPEAMRLSHTQLAAEITATARQAQRQAAVLVAETFGAVGGTDSETYRVITEYLPEPVAEERPRGRTYITPEVDEPPARPQPPRRPPTQRPPDDEPDDYSGDSIYQSK
ncbi:DNA-binding protein YbaB [Actinokineospora baliensis]|uniref:YbaB/EbfC family nucleoid-associated protein n=1 Tax=Actinokineospora baliensis TaxID=547056 RepID=UPI00195B66B5|nr:YbaB/EbfC family nucleoid-associated protein [Actinokineospora baliensis]MBM7774091.1 DNA-binding protein YbaB [Actinokineospora baliensis]